MGKTRQFSTGATRDTDEGKYDYEGFFSPLVLERYGEYMNKHRQQSAGFHGLFRSGRDIQGCPGKSGDPGTGCPPGRSRRNLTTREQWGTGFFHFSQPRDSICQQGRFHVQGSPAV